MRFPVDVQVGPWGIPAHFLFDVLAYSLAFHTYRALRRAWGDAVDVEQRWAAVAGAAVGALAGAKALAWLVDPAVGLAALRQGDLLAGGRTIVGGLLGGTVGVEVAKRLAGVRRSTGDLFAIPVALGIAVGRIGCFLTGLGDRTHGVATSLPWAVDFGDGVPRHPTQLYELAFLALAIAGLLALRPRLGREGDLWKAFLLLYLAWRFAVGFIQPAPAWLGLGAIQWACLAGLAAYAPALPRLARAVIPVRGGDAEVPA